MSERFGTPSEMQHRQIRNHRSMGFTPVNNL
jgi:hypothetical protein